MTTLPSGMFHGLPLTPRRPSRLATLVIPLVLLGLLTGCTGDDVKNTDQQISHACECPALVEAAGQPPPGASRYWPTDWSVSADFGAFYLSGFSNDPDPAQRMSELRGTFADAGWDIVDGLSGGEPQREVWRAYFPSEASPERLLEIVADEVEGQLWITMRIFDDVHNYEGWDEDAYIRALAEGTSQFRDLEAVRERKAADLYREFVSGG